jgi:hypothetical protein
MRPRSSGGATLHRFTLARYLLTTTQHNEALEALSLSLQRHVQTLKSYSHVSYKATTPIRTVPHSFPSTEHHRHYHYHLHPDCLCSVSEESKQPTSQRSWPTIVSILDKFSHICLYRLHEGKWQKDGFEGASFLFERCVGVLPSSWPPSHSSNISERRIPLTVMHDYIHAIHPEDEIQAAEGEYLMYRSYPEFTAKRLAMTKSTPRMAIDSWTDAQRWAPSANDPLTNWRYLLDEKSDKGPHETVMSWFWAPTLNSANRCRTR